MLRFFSVLCATLLSIFIIGSCSFPSSDPVELERVSATIDSSARSIRGTKSGVQMDFPGGLLTASATAEASLVVYDSQYAEFEAKKRLDPGPKAVRFAIDAASIVSGKQIVLSFPYSESGAYDPAATAILVGEPNGGFIALDESFANGRISANLDSGWLKTLAELDKQSKLDLRLLYTVDRPAATMDMSYESSVQFWDDAAKKFTKNFPNGFDISGKKVALVVHGLFSSLEDMNILAGSLSTAKGPGAAAAYDCVVGFEYSMLAGISRQGADMASAYRSLPGFAGVGRLDVFAHSMGNLVSRWAMQRPDKKGESAAAFAEARIGQYVNRYVAIGGPHAGVPFGNTKFIDALMFMLDYPLKWSFACVADLVCDGVPEGSEYYSASNPWKPSAIVGALNYTADKTNGPDYDRLKITTISGNKFSTYQMFGSTAVPRLFYVTYYYSLWKEPVEDGIVAKYSARSPELSRIAKTENLTHIDTWNMNHLEIYTKAEALADIKAMIAKADW